MARLHEGLHVLALTASFAVLTPTAAQASVALSGAPCAAAKLRAAGIEARDRMRCEKRGLASGPVSSCVIVARASRNLAFARAEARSVCIATNDSDDIGGEVDDIAAAAVAELRPTGPGSSRCSGAQLLAMGRAFRQLTRAYALYKRSNDADVLAANLAAAQSAFEASYALATSQGDCLSVTSAAEAFAIVTDGVTRLRGRLSPACGDGVMGPGEICDGSETGSCESACEADCTCAVCPCWNADDLEAAFPPGFFNQNGLGGAECFFDEANSTASIISPERCALVGTLVGYPPRAGAGMTPDLCIGILRDLDPNRDHLCDRRPTQYAEVTPAQSRACYDVFVNSAVVLECE